VTRLRRMILFAAALYIGITLIACGAYKKILYPAPAALPLVVPAGAELLELRASDGAPVHALYFPAAEKRPTLVVFHGNGSTIGDDTDLADALHSRGLGVLLVEYRGYGVSRGSPKPSESGLYLDATTALDALEQRGVRRDHVVLWGLSLGTGVATEMASRGRGAALILLAPFTSIRAMASHYAPVLPTSLIVDERFDTLEKAPKIQVPVLVIHGDADEVIPVAMGKEVAGAFPKAKLIVVHGGHHNDLFASGEVFPAILGFVDSLPPGLSAP
jgi:uncharacterized protein